VRPLIGITASDVYAERGKLYHRAYALNAFAVADAGGLPVYIPPGLQKAVLRDLYDRLDAVLLPGGPDVDPVEYGQERHVMTKVIDAPRDALELTLARWTVEDDRPLFGICRGHQVMNVAFGGTLLQDIPTQVETTLTHDLPDEFPRSTRLHNVEIKPDSRLASILGTTNVLVNSLHHQAVGAPAPGVDFSAYAPDGVVEALEMPDKRFVLSVQWHPEDLYEDDGMMKRLFTEFVDAAREAAARKR
jgi:putative glutamine amidotransferase